MGFSISTVIIFQTFIFVDPTSLRDSYFMQFQTQVSSYCTLSLRGDVRDILGHKAQTKCRPFTCNSSKPSSSNTRFL
jgi:hypothetical protein